MKKKKNKIVPHCSDVWIVLLIGLLVSSASGYYELTWSTIDGGGGTGSGGPYTITCTIGQPDAAWSSGGNYEVLGGFLTGGPLCMVDFKSFARFAEYWLEKGTGLPADLYKDRYYIVDGLDLQVFVDQWLCYCPADWPLK
jgi:hypothetical protein